MFFPDLRGVGAGTLLKCTVKDFVTDELPTYASALAFQLFFSLFPFLLFLIALISVLDLQPFFDWLRQQAELVLPQAAVELINPAIDQLQSQKAGLFSVGILVALWTASAAVRSTMDAMNRAYGVQEGRPAWKRIPLSLLYTVLIAVALLLVAALMVVGPRVMGWLAYQVGIEQIVVVLWSWLRWPLVVVLLMVVVAGVYYVAPDVEQEFRFITPGSVLAVVVWIAASVTFGFYVQNFADYNATYGSIGAIIIFLFYLYISSAVLLFGAELNAVIEHHAREGKEPGEKTMPGEPGEVEPVRAPGQSHAV
ncbi:MAG: YihY/virulence factor BrkB family protein [Pseudomonas sp.]|uniref:YihY/virulence factor BrkB family protein n=1 Tax=Pseudomonas sp. TaxID=306 RepID=UPI003395173F